MLPMDVGLVSFGNMVAELSYPALTLFTNIYHIKGSFRTDAKAAFYMIEHL